MVLANVLPRLVEESLQAQVPQWSVALMDTTFLMECANFVSLVATAKTDQSSLAVLLNCVGQERALLSPALITCHARLSNLHNKLFVMQENI